MKSKNRIEVTLPNPVPTVSLPRHLAETLVMIIQAGDHSINTLELQYAGVCSVHNAIYRLRSLGAQISTNIGPTIDMNGTPRSRIGHYRYVGWCQ